MFKGVVAFGAAIAAATALRAGGRSALLPEEHKQMAMRLLLGLLEWLAARAGANPAADAGPSPWVDPSSADRAGRLVAAPQDALEREVGRSLGHWALWLAVAVVLLFLAAGYLRRRWRAKGEASPAWLTWRGPR